MHRQMDGDGWTDVGQKVITIAHSEYSSGELKTGNSKLECHKGLISDQIFFLDM